MESIRVLSGNPTAEELAATVAVVSSASAQQAAAAAAATEAGVKRECPAWSHPGTRFQVARSWRDSSLPTSARIGR